MKLDDLETSDQIVEAIRNAPLMEPIPDPHAPTESSDTGFRTAAQLAEEVPAEIRWIAWPFAAAGTMTVISGPPKLAGKTTLALRAVAAVLNGTPWLDHPTIQGPVVYLTEEPDVSFRVALARAGLLHRQDLHVLSRHRAPESWQQSAFVARARAAEVGAALIVMDTYAEWGGLVGDTEKNPGDTLRVLAPLKAAARDGFAVLILAHDRKSGGEVGSAIRGSGAFPGAVETIVQVRPGSSATERKLEFRGRLEVPATLIVERLKDGSYVSKGSPDEVQASRVELDTRTVTERLIAVMRNYSHPITREELFQARPEQIGEGRWQRALNSAMENGRIIRTGGGRRGDPTRFALTGDNEDSGNQEALEL